MMSHRNIVSCCSIAWRTITFCLMIYRSSPRCHLLTASLIHHSHLPNQEGGNGYQIGNMCANKYKGQGWEKICVFKSLIRQLFFNISCFLHFIAGKGTVGRGNYIIPTHYYCSEQISTLIFKGIYILFILRSTQ